MYSPCQRGVSCVQQEFSSSVGANQSYCLLVEAHLNENNIMTSSETKLSCLASQLRACSLYETRNFCN